MSFLPKRINIRGCIWKIKLVKDVIDDDGSECEGLCRDRDKTILIDKNLNKRKMVEIFIHEWLHAIWYEIGFDDEEIPKWIEHIYINGIAKDFSYQIDLWTKVFSSFSSQHD